MDKTGKTSEMNLSNEGQNRNSKELEESKITLEQQTERPLNHLESPSVKECSGGGDINNEDFNALGVHQVEFGATGVCPRSQSKQQEETGHVSRNLEHSEGNTSFQCCQPVCSILKGENDSHVEQMNGNVEESEMDALKGRDSDEILELTVNESEKDHKYVYLRMRYLMFSFFKGNTKCLEKIDKRASILYGYIHPTKPIIDLWAVRISVSFIPAEAREEAYRFGTFCLRVDLERGISILLAREGFFCNNNSDIICAFCGRSLQQYHLRLGDRHLNVFLERHRHICNLAHNISMAIYGINLAHHVQVMQGNHDSLCVSGSHYQQQGVCTYAQQIRRPFSNIVPSGTINNETQRFLPWPNLVEHQRMDGNNSIPRNADAVQMENQESNPRQDQSTTEHLAKTTKSGAPATTVQGSATLQADCFMTGATGTSADLPSSQSERDRVTRVDDIVQALVGSSIGTTVIGLGFTRGDVVDGIRRLLRTGERVTADSIICEITKRM
ncbi:uncharacterized protein LOC132735931 [Ruditapes philippinarum]|uniref:uncharacterized protein LOC132735931 n=1 Tax=Ruditapes philippinarum TaxID=129788 RepID=UPI00295A797E|nr:uncharacterized protein LOC132735931 [Ruditapes philippinarum]